MFTSDPMPNEKMRASPAFLTSATISSEFRVPTVGNPSVRKIMTNGRSVFSVRALSALCNASAIAVPPIGFRSAMKFEARLRCSESASTSLPKSGSASVENRTISKRSSPFKFSTQNSSAFFACCNFAPAIEPEVSTTKTTSFGAGLVSFATVGAARIRK